VSASEDCEVRIRNSVQCMTKVVDAWFVKCFPHRDEVAHAKYSNSVLLLTACVDALLRVYDKAPPLVSDDALSTMLHTTNMYMIYHDTLILVLGVSKNRITIHLRTGIW